MTKRERDINTRSELIKTLQTSFLKIVYGLNMDIYGG